MLLDVYSNEVNVGDVVSLSNANYSIGVSQDVYLQVIAFGLGSLICVNILEGKEEALDNNAHFWKVEMTPELKKKIIKEKLRKTP
jgi:hypothetical protein